MAERQQLKEDRDRRFQERREREKARRRRRLARRALGCEHGRKRSGCRECTDWFNTGHVGVSNLEYADALEPGELKALLESCRHARDAAILAAAAMSPTSSPRYFLFIRMRGISSSLSCSNPHLVMRPQPRACPLCSARSRWLPSLTLTGMPPSPRLSRIFPLGCPCFTLMRHQRQPWGLIFCTTRGATVVLACQAAARSLLSTFQTLAARVRSSGAA